MVPRTTPAPRTALDHEGLKTDPFLVVHQTPDQDGLPKSHLESDTRLLGNPLCQHFLVQYLSSEWGLFAKRIDEKTASNRRGPQGNRWLFPDLVAMEDLTIDLAGAVRDFHSISGARKFRIWAFEVKLVLNRSNVRESFFQTVSNSSWANFGYLVASEIQSDETLKELQILCSLHGTGLILLNSSNPDESEIRIPARERQDIDWANANRLAGENRDFMSVIELLKEFHQTGKPKRNEWD